MADRKSAFEVSFPKSVMLREDDRSGLGIRVEIVAVVAHHAPKVTHHVRCKDVLVGDDSHVLNVVGRLMLACLMLHELVWNAVSRELVAHTYAQPIVRREASLIVRGKVSDSRGVVEVLRHDGIQIMLCVSDAGACPEDVFAPGVLALSKRSRRIETASREPDLAVKGWLRVLERVDLDDPAHFSTVLGREARRVNGQRLNVVRLNYRTEAGRPVIRQGYAIHDKLRLVLGLTRVQDGVALVEPSRLRTHKVLQGTPRQGSHTVLDRF